ncbi:carbon storage regulator [Oribacterium sp. WCC10]|uniref:carbon storage regulator n=1 Tax=Oribacterium sp. WCC10 TaxID=1855343 RepID=UPI0008E12571|nr:carbon storage regulator [Oribacterium sp. WCC10]SFG24592.1 carbon storage regulator, CsrA [Oribacterium sp. WCC10]
MLILRRKKNESILIGDNIRITVVESASDGVRLAIDAPKQISILREELSIAEQENKIATSPNPDAITGLQDSLKHITLKKNKPVVQSEETSADEAKGNDKQS